MISCNEKEDTLYFRADTQDHMMETLTMYAKFLCKKKIFFLLCKKL